MPKNLLDDKVLANRLEDEFKEAEDSGQAQTGKENLLLKKGELEGWKEQHAWIASELPEAEALKKTVAALGACSDR